jgi:predicted DnaQ family exonuclease/DinG family helicase
MFKKPFVVLDLETTGVDPKSAEIIEVAAIRYENGKEVGRYESMISIDYELPQIITAITGITDAELRQKGRSRNEVFPEVERILEGAYLLGHNIGFDHSFLKFAKVKLNILGLLDTIPLTQIFFPDAVSYSLESLTDDFGISHESKHRAMGDAEATLDLFKHILKTANDLPKKVIDEIKEIVAKGDWSGGDIFEEIKGRVGGRVEGRVERQIEERIEGVERALTLDEIFGKDGALKRIKDYYEDRPQQIQMAENVLNAFEQGYHLICEAPTGIGKSLAYLAAAANVALTNKSKVLVSTNTINLQQQLFEKDIPLLQQMYSELTHSPSVRVAVLKGRSHYLCLRRLAEFKRRPRLTQEEMILLSKIEVWRHKTEHGDSSEINLSRSESLIWDFELCADKKYCTPQKCKAYGSCYLHEARKKAENADIIIVNHALLCSDLASGGGLLPDYQYLIIDEAHHFEEVATKALGIDIKQENLAIPIKAVMSSLDNLKRRFSGTLFVSGKAFESVDTMLEQIPELQQNIDNFFNVVALFVNRNVPESAYIENLLVDNVISANQEWLNLGESLSEMNEKILSWLRELKKFTDALEMSQKTDQSDFADELMQEIGTLMEQLGHLNDFFHYETEDKKWIRWMSSDMQGTVSLSLAPVTVGSYLKEALYDRAKSIILTSATLGVRLTQDGMDGGETHPFSYLRHMLGLDEKFEELILDSPFNFEKQAYIIIPQDIFPVQAKNHIEQISGFMRDLIKSVGGGMLALFTSYGALENVYLNLMNEAIPKGPKILAQRISGGRAKVMKAYMNNPQKSVLLGTASFWEGVDIAGDALTTLVMHKIPFDVPSDPIYKVRSQMFNNGFAEYSIPRAVLKFRQGFGRLIRSKKDYGVMIVLDDRFLKKDYGQIFLSSLPQGVTIEKMKLAEIPGKVKEWLDLMSSNQ